MDQRPALAEARRKLFEAGEQRVHPGRDEKVLTSGLLAYALSKPREIAIVGDPNSIDTQALLRAVRDG